jgi:kynurenine formamidase
VSGLGPAQDGLPLFAELPMRPDAPAGSSWGVFGSDYEIGTLNFIDPRHILEAAKLVTRGTVLPLNLDLWSPAPTLFHRGPPTCTELILNAGESVDDYLDNFYPHASTHWDALRHYADVDHGFYNGVTLDAVTADGSSLLAIHHWAERGIVGRGVLLDVPRALSRSGTVFDPLGFFPITPAVIASVASEQQVGLRAGDILLIRTGWLEAYSSLTDSDKLSLVASGTLATPGLWGEAIPEFLWDNRVAAAASDTPVFEAQRGGAGLDLDLHKKLIARLGMPIGENWNLASLALDCARDGRYDFLLTSSPLNIPGGAGSPANALAIK